MCNCLLYKTSVPLYFPTLSPHLLPHTSSFIYLLQPPFLHFTSLLLFQTDNQLFSKRLMFSLTCSQLQSQSSLPCLLKLHPHSAHPEDGVSGFIHQTTRSHSSILVCSSLCSQFRLEISTSLQHS
jgi:hypothetical protein